jgi:hypothetical protein
MEFNLEIYSMELGRAILNEPKDKVLNKNRCILLLKFVQDTNGSNSFLIIVYMGRVQY